jgi:hypothetical protein
MKQHPPRQIFEKLVNKNAIKPKIDGPPWQFFLKPLTLLRDFGKIFKYTPPWIFNTCASMAKSNLYTNYQLPPVNGCDGGGGMNDQKIFFNSLKNFG